MYHRNMMFMRNSRILQVLVTLMFVTVILPILFNIFISRANQSASSTMNPFLEPFSLYGSSVRDPENLSNRVDLLSNGSNANLTSLMQVRQNYLRSMTGSSMEEQIAFNFADLTQRLHFAESNANERRQEINQLMREIRYLWGLIHKQNKGQMAAQPNAIVSNESTTRPPSIIDSIGMYSMSKLIS